jgi:hypothetical protein
MNGKTGKPMTPAAVVLTFCLFSLEQSASAQSTDSDCKKAKGKWIDVHSGGNTTHTARRPVPSDFAD